jgi:hypothetical protein
MREIDESDWKIIRKLHAAALERFCERVLNDIESVRADTEKSFHQRYLEIYRAMRKRDKEMALVFDNLRRSAAITHLFAMKSLGLVTEAEFAQLSQETRDSIGILENL